MFQHDPAEIDAGFNLAVVECGLGNREAALATLERILEFSPDSGRAVNMEEKIRRGRQCGEK